MKRRALFNAGAATILGSIFNPILIPPKPKTCLVAVGTSACALAAIAHRQLLYRVKYHGIDTTNNIYPGNKENVTCWYNTQLTPAGYKPGNPTMQQLDADWDHNMSRPNFRSHMAHMMGEIVILANMGRITGSYTTLKLVHELSKVLGNNVSVIATTPFGVDWYPFGYNLAAKCLTKIKATGVPVTVFDIPEVFKKQNLSMPAAYRKMDQILIKYITDRLR